MNAIKEEILEETQLKTPSAEIIQENASCCTLEESAVSGCVVEPSSTQNAMDVEVGAAKEQEDDKNKNQQEPFDLKKEIAEWVKVLITAAVLAFLITSVVKPTIVIGPSMEDTLHNGDYLLVYRWAYHNSQPAYDDIIVFDSNLQDSNHEDKSLVKRVIGKAGDHIEIRDGKVFRNEKELQEIYLKDGTTNVDTDVIVPENSLFVMGDNRLRSNDSRYPDVGFIPVKKVMGRVFLRLFPFQKIQNF